MWQDFTVILIFAFVGFLFVWATLFLWALIRAKGKKSDLKLTPYECGEELLSSANVQFNYRFYIIALIYLLFDVELVLLYPIAVIFKDLPYRIKLVCFFEFFLFIIILVLGLVYAWAKGYLDWLKSEIHPS